MAGGALKSKTKEFLCLLQESSELLQETSCRTFGRAKSNFKSESDGGSLLVGLARTFVSIPCPRPSFFFTSLCFSLCFYRNFLQKLWETRHAFQKVVWQAWQLPQRFKSPPAVFQLILHHLHTCITAKIHYVIPCKHMQKALRQKSIEPNLFLP